MEPLASEMTKDPSSWSETRGSDEAKTSGQVAIQIKHKTQDVEFQPLRIPYIKEIRVYYVDRQSAVLGVNELQKCLI